MEGGSVVANRVERGDYRKLTANKGYHENNTEPLEWGGGGGVGCRILGITRFSRRMEGGICRRQ